MSQQNEIIRKLMEPKPDTRHTIGEPLGFTYWLAYLDQYGNPTLEDGAHSDASGALEAATLIEHLGLRRGRRFALARVELFEVEATNA